VDRVEWPIDALAGAQAPVGVVTVSFNTRELTAQMIYSLFRHIQAPRFHLVVVWARLVSDQVVLSVVSGAC
jgi:hypothetical protein